MAYDAITPVKMGQGSIGTSATTRYTVPALTRAIVTSISICNTSTTASINVSVYVVPSGGSPGATNILLSNIALPPNGVFDMTGALVMNPGDFISDIASAAGCTITITGGEAL